MKEVAVGGFPIFELGISSQQDDPRKIRLNSVDSKELEAVATRNHASFATELTKKFNVTFRTVLCQIKRIGKVLVVEK